MIRELIRTFTDAFVGSFAETFLGEVVAMFNESETENEVLRERNRVLLTTVRGLQDVIARRDLEERYRAAMRSPGAMATKSQIREAFGDLASAHDVAIVADPQAHRVDLYIVADKRIDDVSLDTILQRLPVTLRVHVHQIVHTT